MTPKQRMDQHDKEIAAIRAAQVTFEKNMARLEKSMTDLVNQQGETNRTVAELSRTVDRFIRSLEGRGGNGHGKPPKTLR